MIRELSPGLTPSACHLLLSFCFVNVRMSRTGKGTPEDFHARAQRDITDWNTCVAERGEHRCLTGKSVFCMTVCSCDDGVRYGNLNVWHARGRTSKLCLYGHVPKSARASVCAFQSGNNVSSPGIAA